jgi:seryl-tRNA synthetase
MTQYDDDFDFDNENEQQDDGSLPAQLRKKIKALQKELDAANREKQEALSQLSRLKARDVLRERKVEDPRVIRFMEKDGVDFSDESAIDKWLEENGDLFGYQAGKASPQDEQMREGLERMAAAEDKGEPSTRYKQLLAEIQNANSKEELDAILQRNADIRVST